MKPLLGSHSLLLTQRRGTGMASKSVAGAMWAPFFPKVVSVQQEDTEDQDTILDPRSYRYWEKT